MNCMSLSIEQADAFTGRLVLTRFGRKHDWHPSLSESVQKPLLDESVWSPAFPRKSRTVDRRFGAFGKQVFFELGSPLCPLGKAEPALIEASQHMSDCNQGGSTHSMP